MTPHRKLDAVLEVLNRAYSESVTHIPAQDENGAKGHIWPNSDRRFRDKVYISWFILETEYEQGDFRDIDLMLEYLQKLDMICADIMNGITRYAITWEGRTLIEKGGYTQSLKDADRERKSEKLKDFLLILGTWSAAFGLIANAGAFLFRRGIHWIVSINFFSVMTVFLIGILTGIAILLTAKEVLQQKDTQSD